MSYQPPSGNSIAINFTEGGATSLSSPLDISWGLSGSALIEYVPVQEPTLRLGGSYTPSAFLDFSFGGSLNAVRPFLTQPKASISLKATYSDAWQPQAPNDVVLNFKANLGTPSPTSADLNFGADAGEIPPAYYQLHIKTVRPSLRARLNYHAIPETARIHLTQPRASISVEEVYLGYVIRTTKLQIKSNRPQMRSQMTYLGIPPRFATVGAKSLQPRLDLALYYDNRVHRFPVKNDQVYLWDGVAVTRSRIEGDDWEVAQNQYVSKAQKWAEADGCGYLVQTRHQVMLHLQELYFGDWKLAKMAGFFGQSLHEVCLKVSEVNRSPWTATDRLLQLTAQQFEQAIHFQDRYPNRWNNGDRLTPKASNNFGVAIRDQAAEFIPWNNGRELRPTFGEYIVPVRPDTPDVPINPEPGRPKDLNFQCTMDLTYYRRRLKAERILHGEYAAGAEFNFVGGSYTQEALLRFDFLEQSKLAGESYVEYRIWVQEDGPFYKDPTNVPLRFSNNPCGLTDAERGVPTRSMYIVINSMSMCRSDDGSPIEIMQASIRTDKTSWAWSLSGSIDAKDFSKIMPDANGPVMVELELNGYRFDFLIESYSDERVFGSRGISISGRSVTAYLDSPFAPARTFTYDTEVSAKQVATSEVERPGLVSGFSVDWQITGDGAFPSGWVIPGNAMSYQNLTPVEVLGKVASAAGGYLLSHPYEKKLIVKSGYPTASWHWNEIGQTIDLVLPKSIVTRQSLKWSSSQAYDGIYVSGENYGVTAFVYKYGTIGSNQMEMVTHALIGDTFVAKERGRAELSKGGKAASISLDIPLSQALAGLVLPGTMVEVDPAGIPGDELWRGLVRATSIEASWTQTLGITQTIELERHY